MKKTYFYAHVCPLLLTFIFFTACNGQDKLTEEEELSNTIQSFSLTPPQEQIADYIRNIFQDKNGNLWFGTNGYGVAHYDGDSVSYFSNAQGFDGQQITGMAEDPDKNIWFA
ncbi:MAG: two-component regulator propeller domain-containing protein, partial [Bacteroidota bacterium]